MINGAEQEANNLAQSSTAADIRSVLAHLIVADPIDVERILQIIRDRTKQPIAVLRKIQGEITRSHFREVIKKPDWAALIRTSPEGEPIPDAANIIIPLQNDPVWKGRIAYDEFHQRPMFVNKPPWANGHWLGPSQFTDADEARVLIWMQKAGIHCRMDAVRQALSVVVDDNRFHPVRDYLDSLQWDGTPRIDSWLTYYLGVEPIADYTGPVGARWLISGVARIYEPGCLAKYCLVLEGEQDLKKSSALEVLGSPFFTDDVAELGTKDASMQIGNAWIVELSELDSVRRAHISAIKAFISRKTDRFRKPFGRYIIEQPRQCIMAGTVNPSTEYLTDDTGGVRFWPVLCAAIDIDALRNDRDQLWAEAIVRYRAGEKWWLDVSELKAARGEQEARFAADSWEDAIASWLRGNPMIVRVTTSEILKSVFDLPIAEHDRAKQTRVGIILRQRLLWRSKQGRVEGVPERWYERPEVKPQPSHNAPE